MSRCLWTDCNNDARLKSPYCSGTCEKRAQRLSGTESDPSGTNVPVEVGQESSGTQVGQMEFLVSLEGYQLDQEENTGYYAARTNPGLLNWGEPMSLNELKTATLKANRVPIRGDWDYDGCCEKVDNQWQVKK